MTDAGLPPRVQRFLTTHIDSIEKLEVLLLLRARTDRVWTAPAVALELRITEASAARRLAELKTGGLLLQDGVSGEAYRFSPLQPDEAQSASELAAAYAARRVSVISFIFSRPMDRVRGFADAFVLKPDKDGKDHG
ncbi:hypothetical protein G4177_02355 [Corallococcus sp. ZKHCc1 1396]|uniref:ArsR family transcriptional regulator n=1 Tax=Corallococcus soli TaxID=2710757 RepID=A0ABR9PGH0_9BACT|nr:hypothetical protein [Corallococcus sp. BB11-1]MBE4747015.1 hypothetical protein [Corallococcus soli]MCY1030572.1 hypothetical protein [Corallococcus sp. BB11-1]RYZ45624.1 MAG: hypothetical protein EOO72_03795 [Myxococcaceae bacterium]